MTLSIDMCKFCGHAASWHEQAWDRDQPSRINVTYCKRNDCPCDRFSLDERSYQYHFPRLVIGAGR